MEGKGEAMSIYVGAWSDTLCHFSGYRSSEDEVIITRLLEKSIRRSEAVDREALCILAGEKVS